MSPFASKPSGEGRDVIVVREVCGRPSVGIEGVKEAGSVTIPPLPAAADAADAPLPTPMPGSPMALPRNADAATKDAAAMRARAA